MEERMISIKNILIPLAFPISLTIYIVLNLISNFHYTTFCVLTQGCLHFFNVELPANIIFALIASWVFTIIIIIVSFNQGYDQETYNEICLITSFVLFITFFFTWYETYQNIDYVFDNFIANKDRTIYQSRFSSVHILFVIGSLFLFDFLTIMLKDSSNKTYSLLSYNNSNGYSNLKNIKKEKIMDLKTETPASLLFQKASPPVKNNIGEFKEELEPQFLEEYIGTDVFLIEVHDKPLTEWIDELSKKFKKHDPASIEKLALDLHKTLSTRDSHYSLLPYSAKNDNLTYAAALIFYAVHLAGVYSGSKRYPFDPSDWFKSIKGYRRKYFEIIKTIEVMYFIIPIKLITELHENGMTYYPHIPQVEKIRLHPSKELSHACHLSKNLYNHVNWLLHTMYQTTLNEKTKEGETAEQRAERERRQSQSLGKIRGVFDRYDEIEMIKINKRDITRWEINTGVSNNGFPLILDSTFAKKFMPTIVKFSRHYRALPAKVSQQIIRVLCNSWNSYFQSVIEYKKVPSKFKARPSPPGYKGSDGEFSLYFTNQACSIKNGQLLFPYKTKIGKPQFSSNNTEEETNVWEKYITEEKDFTEQELELLNKIPVKADNSYRDEKIRWFGRVPEIQIITVREHINSSNFQQVRIIPKGKSYKLEIIYNKRLKETKNIDQSAISQLKSQVQQIKIKRKKTESDKKNIHNLRKQINKLNNENYDRFSKNLRRENAISIDLGANILLSIANNIGENPILIKGSHVKIANFKALKHLKRIQKQISLLSNKYAENVINPFDTEEQQLEITNFFKSIYNIMKYEGLENSDREVANRLFLKLKQVWDKRNQRIENEMHIISRFVIEYCKHREIGTIVIGYNEGWKQEVKLEHKTQERFMKIPFAKLRDMIAYKARLSGIDSFIINESHTSKCSALDDETVEHHEKYLGLRGPPMQRSKPVGYSNKYKARGLLRTPRTIQLMETKGTEFEYIHSDINGALNIGRKGALEYFNSIEKHEMKLSPIFVKNLSVKGAHTIYDTS